MNQQTRKVDEIDEAVCKTCLFDLDFKFPFKFGFILFYLILFQSEDIIFKFMKEWSNDKKPNEEPFEILSPKIPHIFKQIYYQQVCQLYIYIYKSQF